MWQAGSQFSFPLIDLDYAVPQSDEGWESVLFSPDRLARRLSKQFPALGVSSLFP